MSDTCKTCAFWHVDELGDGWCVNSDSPNCADVTYPDDTCEQYEHQPQPECEVM